MPRILAPISFAATAVAAALAMAQPGANIAPVTGLPIIRVAEPAAASADVDFLFRLAMMEGHLLVGHELLEAKQAPLAVPHFGHPVKELYDDVGPYLKAKKFPDFDKDLIALEAAVTAAPYAPATEAKYQAVMATIRKARDLAPQALRASLPEMIKVCASTIDAASGEYSEAIEQGKITSVVEYHDSRGYLEYVARQVAELRKAHPDQQSQALLDRFAAVLGKAKAIVGDLLPSPTPKASVDDYRAIAAQAREVVAK
ncbi:MAG TPA: hypothetical protein VG651_25475 [Stellaceae bacterium]|nr:hypothetical protein [Stellaceae bacterium]